MKLFSLKISLGVLHLFIITSCTTVYVPNSLNTPLLSKKNEATFSINSGITGTDLQSSFAFTDNLAVMLNYSFISQENEEALKQKFGEFALGYFSESHDNNIAEIFLGFGYGEASSVGKIVYQNYINDNISAKSNFYRLFIQGDFGIKGKIIETGLSIRGSYLYFSNIKYSLPIFDADMSIDNFFVTPSFFFKIGGPLLKFQAQIAYSKILNTSKFIFYEPLIFSVGINLRIGALD